MKTCGKCNLSYSESKFYKDKSTKDGLNRYCKWCKNEYSRKCPGNKARQLRLKFGITLKEYEAQLLFQKFSCAICTTHQSRLEKTLAVDHCHDGGFVRGLVCDKCNYNIGKYEVGFLRKSYPTYSAIENYVTSEGVWE